MTKTATCVISQRDRVPRDTTSTVSVSFTDRPSTPPTRAATSAESTSTADAITTRVTARTGIIRSTVSAIVDLIAIRNRRVAISADITRTSTRPTRQRRVPLARALATTTVSTVPVSPWTDATATRIVRRLTAERLAGILAASTASQTATDNTRLMTETTEDVCIVRLQTVQREAERTSASITSSAVSGER